MTPELFAPGVFREPVNAGPAFSPDGQEVYWRPATGAHMNFRKLVDGVWSDTGFPSFDRGDDSPAFSLDGNRLYFTRWDGNKENIWFVERAGEGWSAPVALPEAVNSLRLYWQFSFGKNGDLYFGAFGPAGTARDIYCAELVAGEYSRATRLGDAINSDQMEHSPCIARDGSYLLFSREYQTMEAFNARQPASGSDLFVSFREEDGSWRQAIRFGAPINSDAFDHCPTLSSDGKYLFFISDRGGRLQIYWVDAGVIEELRPE
jgi:Tol biopolymer transport system component